MHTVQVPKVRCDVMAPEADLFFLGEGGEILTDRKCSSCNLCKNPNLKTCCMEGTGSEEATFLFAGHSAGKEDDEIGQAFTGSNGRLLRELLEQSSWDLEDVYFTNAIKCALLGEKPRDSYWKRCKGHFRNELERVKPKAIVSFGATSLKWLTGFSGPRRFRRRGLPCVLDPRIVVYPFEQAIALKHLEGHEYYKARALFISDLKWLLTKKIGGTLHLVDDVQLDYKHAQTIEDVRAFLDEFPEGTEVYCDLENGTPELEGSLFPYPGHRIVAVGFSNRPGHARTIPFQARGVASLRFWTEEEEAQIHEWLGEFWRTHSFVGHNFVQYDQKWLCDRWDLDHVEINFEPMLAAHLLDEERGGHGLQDLAIRYTKMNPWKSEFTVRDITRCQKYLAKDLDAGSRVYPIIKEKLNDAQMWLHTNVQVPLAHEARRMEQRGVMIDVEAMEKLGKHLEERIAEEEKEIYAYTEVKAWQLHNGKRFNPESTHHLRDLLENYFKLPKIKATGTGLYSTDREVLEYYEDKCPFVGNILRRRRSSKLKGTYVGNIRERVEEHGSIVHYSIKLHGTVTGRPSFENPNVGNIPRADTAERAGIEDPKLVKAMFIPRPGRCFLQIDVQQAELRTLAMYSRDENLSETYRQGLDAHSATAAKAYGVPLEEVTKSQRSNAKRINFGVVFGKQEESLILDFVTAQRDLERANARKENREPDFTREMEAKATSEAQAFLAAHKRAHPDVWRWMREQETQIRRYGYQETFFGRRRHYHKIDHAAIRQSYNFPIQSTAAEFLHVGLIRSSKILRKLNLDAYPVLTVYDSVVYSCTFANMWEVAEIGRDVLENLGFPFMSVPFKVDLEAGLSWGNLHPVCLETKQVLR